MTYAKRFQFSLAELLLLSMWTGAAVLLAVPYRARGLGQGANAAEALPPADVTLAVVVVLAVSAAAGALGLWRANRLEAKGLRRVAGLSAYLLGASLVIVFVLTPPLPGRGMASNESLAIAACKTYAEAQDLYRRTDWDGDGVFEYAQDLQTLRAASLRACANAFEMPQAFAAAEVPAGRPETGTPYGGYVFKVLTGQGPQAPGGSKTYVVAGSGASAHSMTLGYGVVAAPAVYGYTGINTFIINNTGTVYQEDFGEATPQVFGKMDAYDPHVPSPVAE